MDPQVDDYISRSAEWREELTVLRTILLSCRLTEGMKWSKPCYQHEGKNIVILQEMKGFLSLMFFKGALLSDPEHVLEDQGPNSPSARYIRITSVEDTARLSETVKTYVAEAIGVEESGLGGGPTPDIARGARRGRPVDFRCEYLGGHPEFPKAQRTDSLAPVKIRFDGTGITVSRLGHFSTSKFHCAWDQVGEVSVEGRDEVTRRVTVTRLALIGLFAFGAKKKRREKEAFISVALADSEFTCRVPEKSPHEVRAAIAPFRALASASPDRAVEATAGPQDLAAQLRELKSLRDEGALSADEFEAAKRSILNKGD